MNRKNWTWSMLLVGVALATATARAQTEDDWTRDFRISMQVGWNIKANFTTSGQLGISGSQPGPTGVSGVNHTYDDGYVKVDQTGNAGVPRQTSFWGYNNASQLSGQTLTYTASTAVNVPTIQTSASDAPYFGFDMAYGGTITYWNAARARIGWEFGFGLLPININDSQNLPGTFDQVVQTFSTGPIVVPQAPYNGGSSGIGPTIPDVASPGGDQTVAGLVTGTRTLDVMLYNLRLGPTLHWDLGPRWGLSVSAGPAFGIVNGDYKYNESNVFATGGSVQNTGQFGGTEFVYGGYANALALFRLEKNGDIFLGVQYLGLTSAKFSNGGREATLNLDSGIYLTAGVNWAF